MVRVESLLKITTCLCAVTGFISVVEYLDAAYIVGFICLAALAVLADIRKTVFFPRWLLNILSVGAMIPPALKIGPATLVEPVLNGLALLMGIKLLEDKKARDYLQIYLICTFLLIGSTLVSLKISFLFYFLLLFPLGAFSLMLLAYFTRGRETLISTENAGKLLNQALILSGLAIPVCALFFVVLPRADSPLFSLTKKVAGAHSGFSDSVSLGDVAEIQEDTTVAFRAEMPRMNEADLFWRGVELDEFDGRTWKRSPIPMEMEPEEEAIGEKTEQTIYLEPYGSRYLFALDHPIAVYPEKARHWKKLAYMNEYIEERVRYKALSLVSGFWPEVGIDTERYLELPQGLSPRIAELAGAVVERGWGGDPASSLMLYFRSSEFTYSLEALPTSNLPLEEFLFQTRRGNCEYFASALAVMLRSVGIPSRLIGGYRGGSYNPAANYYLVLQKDAHVWVEAYDSNGWRRLDPTPAASMGAAAYRKGFTLQLKVLFDTFNYYWEKFVIIYDLSEQIAILKKIRAGLKSPSSELERVKAGLGRLAGFVPFLLLASLAVFLIARRRKKPEEVLVDMFVRRMAKRGYRKRRSEGFEEFVGRIEDPGLKIRAGAFASGFQDVFYRDRLFSVEDVKRLKASIRDL